MRILSFALALTVATQLVACSDNSASKSKVSTNKPVKLTKS